VIQRLKPRAVADICGTDESVPFRIWRLKPRAVADICGTDESVPFRIWRLKLGCPVAQREVSRRTLRC